MAVVSVAAIKKLEKHLPVLTLAAAQTGNTGTMGSAAEPEAFAKFMFFSRWRRKTIHFPEEFTASN